MSKQDLHFCAFWQLVGRLQIEPPRRHVLGEQPMQRAHVANLHLHPHGVPSVAPLPTRRGPGRVVGATLCLGAAVLLFVELCDLRQELNPTGFLMVVNGKDLKTHARWHTQFGGAPGVHDSDYRCNEIDTVLSTGRVYGDLLQGARLKRVLRFNVTAVEADVLGEIRLGPAPRVDLNGQLGEKARVSATLFGAGREIGPIVLFLVTVLEL